MSGDEETSVIEREAMRKIRWRIFPFMTIGMATCFLDRVNIGFAALQMNADIGLTPTAFGFAAGVFFFGYFFFEVPSNLALAKYGPRLWLFRIMLTWGLVCMATAWVTTPFQLYIVRFLLGVAEAGFFPGLVYYVTLWFRGREHARAVSFIVLGSYSAAMLAGPLSGWLMQFTPFGFKGWQWLFLVEGAIPFLFSFVLLALWTDRPEKAKWLTPEERDWVVKSIAAEEATRDTPRKITLREALTRPGTLVLTLVYFLWAVGQLGLLFWMPQLVKNVGTGLSSLQIGFVTVLPTLCMTVAMLLWARHSDKTGERHWHIVVAALVGAAGLYLVPFCDSLITAVGAMSLAAIGLGGCQATFWTASTELLGPKEKAAGLALINSGSALGGFVGPYVAGIARDLSGNYWIAMMILATAPVLMAVLIHGFYSMKQSAPAQVSKST
ncbi:MFS transporter [Rhodoplanes sp. TEM]|uniref:MFS transporter n=1 Tax=Rhodoplanes tepidamans TaxID=200616 RepID=A0ABT5JFU7_RHOTP|nr:MULTISPECIES: MFS transporter [Rhodoplanes]MDC7788283.1 MFS transporter [Rhodoplanes tepidamans]MDC7987095.1 MFS transporter [Rhodoplanes sp. TEM]MDQ0355664.1 ACS family tartrate transporter-like MFS transporter [Rhodoplanes tepidamans]